MQCYVVLLEIKPKKLKMTFETKTIQWEGQVRLPVFLLVNSIETELDRQQQYNYYADYC